LSAGNKKKEVLEEPTFLFGARLETGGIGATAGLREAIRCQLACRGMRKRKTKRFISVIFKTKNKRKEKGKYSRRRHIERVANRHNMFIFHARACKVFFLCAIEEFRDGDAALQKC
jgi:hypothetical protein